MNSTILIVDDHPDIRETLMDILEDAGYAPVVAPNGRVALEVLRSGLVPRVVLLDLQMPVMDGNSFLEIWRADPELSKIPVVVISANADRAENLHDVHGRDLLRLLKPTVVDELLRVIDCRLWLSCLV